jgi:hypothetical protein
MDSKFGFFDLKFICAIRRSRVSNKINSKMFLIVLTIIIVVMLSCSMPNLNIGGGSSDSNQTPGQQETVMALRLKGTVDALGKSTEDANKGKPREKSPTPPPEPTTPPLPSDTPPQPTEPPAAAPTQELGARIKKANVLVFEDIRGYPALDQRVHAAVTNMDFSGGRVVEVGDAVGNFMQQLNSPTKWDLIVVSAEARSWVRGEFWDVIYKQVQHGVGLVAEVWYLDELANANISSLLHDCGVRLERDWGRDPYKFIPENYSIFWLEQDSPVFSTPNSVEPLISPTIYWANANYGTTNPDAGDLLMLGSGGDAILLAGSNQNEKSRHGVLTTCMGGRVILQTFSTHDYQRSHMVPLWENYMYNTLTARFKQME